MSPIHFRCKTSSYSDLPLLESLPKHQTHLLHSLQKMMHRASKIWRNHTRLQHYAIIRCQKLLQKRTRLTYFLKRSPLHLMWHLNTPPRWIRYADFLQGFEDLPTVESFPMFLIADCHQKQGFAMASNVFTVHWSPRTPKYVFFLKIRSSCTTVDWCLFVWRFLSTDFDYFS